MVGHLGGRARRRFPDGVIVAGILLCPGAATGANWLVPEQYPTIRSAIDVGASGDTVLVSPGTYHGIENRDIELHGKDLIVRSRTGPEETTLDCGWSGRGFYLHEWETRAAVIEGLTIANGRTDDIGGGIFCSLSYPTIRNCRIVGCSAFRGGGLALRVFDGVVEDCIISGNSAEQHGGGIWFELGEPELSGCTIAGNAAQGNGGGVTFGGPGPNRLFGCTVVANSAQQIGGGIYAFNSLLLERCIVWDNCAVSSGPEMRCGDADVRCSDLDTTGVQANGIITYDQNCIAADPLFCSPLACGLSMEGDWSLQSDSPCLPESSPCGSLIGALGQGCGGMPSGACCLAGGSCRVLPESECADQQGEYQGDQTVCAPNPCLPTPVEATSWGKLKARYRAGSSFPSR